MSRNANWYEFDDIDAVDSPALIVYPERIKANIRLLQSRVNNKEQLRPHVKTNKMAEVCSLMMKEGIDKFKCATIAEAEMLAAINAPDVLLAYQPVGPKVSRFLKLIKTFPSTRFSCLVDNLETAQSLSKGAVEEGLRLSVFIDVNGGMNRTGIMPGKAALELATYCLKSQGLQLAGLHLYDGHLRDKDLNERKQKCDKSFQEVWDLAQEIRLMTKTMPLIVAGGTPTFPFHASRNHVECSPGTFIFWDWGYATGLPEQYFNFAALVISRVISIIDNKTLCLDLGHKSIAAENPFPRVHFLNAPLSKSIAQSEEHLVITLENAGSFKIGDVFYGVPVHICPTVALYDKAFLVENNKLSGTWNVIARKRSISI